MDSHIDEFYQASFENSSHGHFHAVIALNNEGDLSWEEVSKKVPLMNKGWYELSHLSSKDRIDFIYEHWVQQLPFNLKLEDRLKSFFSSLDDIGIYLVQQKWDDPFDAHMVYSIKNNSGFYRGALPASESSVQSLQKNFSKYLLPEDYLAFLTIHNGFWKTTDSSGLLKIELMWDFYQRFQAILSKEPGLMTSKGRDVDPTTLIPFYESFGMPYYQCFWAEWYPEQEMGNVYYSSTTKTISDIKNEDLASETLAFPTFSEWLAFYLERIE